MASFLNPPVQLGGTDGTPVSTTNKLPVDISPAAVRTTLQASAAQTASGNSASQSVGAFRELLVLINVTAASGTTPTLNFFIDSSLDGGTTWVQIASGAQITAVGTQAISLGAPSNAFGDTVRLRWTIAGTTPSFTFSAVSIAKT